MKHKIVLKDEGQKLNILGDHQQIKLTGKDTNGRFLAIYQDNSPNTQIPMHVHQNEDEVYKIVEGEVEFTVGEKKSVLKSGDTIFLPKNIPHAWKVVGKSNAKVYLDIFPSGLEDMFEELSKLPAGPPDFPQIAVICRRYGISFV
ncbi:cupin domain-containing protein [Hymenobacter rubripertinctus]|uniref:Cupin domain-containing protein n=1 Tax=Hymenobacter rubripertinctus TaxID=2029981 RepID=A0A418R0N6_9BACT|nr:cupin domain-containing protein [Hymenobacter rubripertinctus]RIY10983.1 cupin domain-containing protein [Hymenobacter rubripertinctus]